MAAKAGTRQPLIGSALLNGRVVSMEGAKSDLDNLMTHEIELRQQVHSPYFAQRFVAYARGEEGAPVLGGINKGELVVIEAHIEKGNPRNAVIIADSAVVVPTIERFERKFDLTGQLDDRKNTSWAEGDMVELTIAGQRGEKDESVCVKAFKDRVELARAVELGALVHVTGRVKTREQEEDGQRLTSLHLDTIEVLS